MQSALISLRSVGQTVFERRNQVLTVAIKRDEQYACCHFSEKKILFAKNFTHIC